ncbi:hypothetical protein SDC9_147178 [bioreactor metagenome]|uniref:Uncharacterized protein n=1 Tax=bioreactor metagenome TaxID=1076179 RepID=A0A645EGU8_9ZZZZ
MGKLMDYHAGKANGVHSEVCVEDRVVEKAECGVCRYRCNVDIITFALHLSGISDSHFF